MYVPLAYVNGDWYVHCWPGRKTRRKTRARTWASSQPQLRTDVPLRMVLYRLVLDWDRLVHTLSHTLLVLVLYACAYTIACMFCCVCVVLVGWSVTCCQESMVPHLDSNMGSIGLGTIWALLGLVHFLDWLPTPPIGGASLGLGIMFLGS